MELGLAARSASVNDFECNKHRDIIATVGMEMGLLTLKLTMTALAIFDLPDRLLGRKKGKGREK